MNEQARFVPYLKVAVIVMGVMIFAGLIGLGYMLYNKSVKRQAAEEAGSAAGPAAADGTSSSGPAGTLRALNLGLPQGSHVAEMTATEDRLVLNVRVPGQGERIVILDLRKGGVVGNVALEGATP